MANTQDNDNKKKPSVLIVGAGLGGLTLALLLERAGIQYQVLERSNLVRPIGSAMSVSFVVMPMLRQLGILDELIAAGKPGVHSQIFNESRERQYMIDYTQTIKMSGYEGYIISRPDLYGILLKHVPEHRILRSKRVVSIDQDRDPDLVTVDCEDGSTYSAQILVGADGAHSIVRRSLYAQLTQKNKLPSSDQEELRFKTVCLIGQTSPLDPEVFPEVNDPMCTFHFTIGEDKPYSWATFTTQQNTICWSALHHLDKSYRVSQKDEYSRANRYYHRSVKTQSTASSTTTASTATTNSSDSDKSSNSSVDDGKEIPQVTEKSLPPLPPSAEAAAVAAAVGSEDWGPSATEVMCEEVRGYSIASGDGKTMVLADLIDKTPKDQMTKVMLEEKLFKTWYSGRVVLLGDACHKMNPSGGEGAMNAMQDALAIANWLNVLPSTSKPDLERAFKEYKKERYPIAKVAFKNSQRYGRLYGKTLGAGITRSMMKNMPGWLFTLMMKKITGNRPRVAFLPPPVDTGNVKPWPQRSFIKTQHLTTVKAN